MHDDKTEHLKLPLPHADNTLDQDLPRLRKSFETLDAEVHGLKENDGTAEKLEAFTSDLDRYKAGIAEQLAAYKDASNKDIATFSAGYAKALGDQAAVVEAAHRAHEKSPDAHEEQIAAAVANVKIPDIRKRLTGNGRIYVRPDGNDSNDGSANTPEKAVQTLAGALNLAKSIDGNGYALTIMLAPGTYAGGATVYGFHTHSFSGFNIASTDSTDKAVIDHNGTVSITCQLFANVTFSNIKFLGSLRSLNFGCVSLKSCEFDYRHGQDNKQIIYVEHCSMVSISTSLTISGSASGALYCRAKSYILFNGNLAVSGNPNYSWGFAIADCSSLIRRWGGTFTGSATGYRFNVSRNSMIDSNGGGPNYFPGSTTGTSGTGGTYV